MAIIKVPSGKQVFKKFKPYAAELGNVIYSWNRLQESFAFVLWWTLGRPQNNVVGALWHSIPSDTQQRRCLRAAIKEAPESIWEKRPRAKADFLWALDAADDLAGRRNDAVHSPYFMLTDETGTRLHPNEGLGNKRAKNLLGKELLKEFSSYADDASALWRFVIGAYEALIWTEHTWPEKPALHLHEPRENSQKSRRKNNSR